MRQRHGPSCDHVKKHLRDLRLGHQFIRSGGNDPMQQANGRAPYAAKSAFDDDQRIGPDRAVATYLAQHDGGASGEFAVRSARAMANQAKIA
jgi:hypothetical protein